MIDIGLALTPDPQIGIYSKTSGTSSTEIEEEHGFPRRAKASDETDYHCFFAQNKPV